MVRCGVIAWLGVTLAAITSADWTDCPVGCACKWNSGKKLADCANRGYREIPKGLSPEIQVLDLSGNNIQSLHKDAFVSLGLHNLQKIYLRGSNVKNVNKDAFRGLKILIELNLSGNLIRKLSVDTFAGSEKLRYLFLNNNPLDHLPSYQFPPLGHLSRLDLSNCQIRYISVRAFDNLEMVETLSLEGNRLTNLKPETFRSMSKLISLTLGDNPWKCDCHLKPLREWMEENKLQLSPQCAEPERLTDKTWKNIPSGDFACRPLIRIPSATVLAQVGGNVTLSCEISANPAPDAKWVLNGRILTNMSQIPFSPQTYVIHEEGYLTKWSNLTITNVDKQDAGDYLCVGDNKGGIAEKNVTVMFELPPMLVPVSFLSNPVLAAVVAGGVLLGIVILVICCCFCCRAKTKPSHPQQHQKINVNGHPHHVRPEEQRNFIVNPIEKPPRIGSYEKVPQTDVEMESRPRCADNETFVPSYSEETCVEECDDDKPSSSTGRSSTEYPLTAEPILVRTGERGSRNYPDLLDIPNRGQQSSPVSSASTVPDTSQLPQLNTSFLGPAVVTPGAYSNPRTQSPFATLNHPFPSVANPNRPGYVTLPRRPRTPSWTSTPNPAPTRGEPLIKVDPIYDNLGPRTTADGSSRLSLTLASDSAPSPPLSDSGLPTYYVPLDDPSAHSYSTLPRTGRASNPGRVNSGGARPRASLSADLIEPLNEEPEVTEDEKPNSVTDLPKLNGDGLGLVNGSTNSNNGAVPRKLSAGKVPPKPPPKPKPKKVPPSVPPRSSSTQLNGQSYQDEGVDGTEV